METNMEHQNNIGILIKQRDALAKALRGMMDAFDGSGRRSKVRAWTAAEEALEALRKVEPAERDGDV